MVVSCTYDSAYKRGFSTVIFFISVFFPNTVLSETDRMDASVVELIFCYSENGIVQDCSQNFIEECLGANKSSAEFPGIEKACLGQLIDAWDIVQAGLVKRGQQSYQNSQRYNFKNLIKTRTEHDEATCAFDSDKNPPNVRELDLLYCRLAKSIARIQFLKDDYTSAKVQNQTRRETTPQTGIR